MSYEFDIFVSYRRTDTIGKWVKNHLVPKLQLRLDEVSPDDIRIFCDSNVAEWESFRERQRQLSKVGCQ